MSKKGYFNGIFGCEKPIVGMVHLKPLPGSPLYDPSVMSMDKIIEIAVEEAKILEAAGIDGIMIENNWDFPYLKGEDVGHETTAALAAAGMKVRDAIKAPIGMSCHLNGGIQSVAAAVATGAQWVRIYEYVNAYISNAGLIEGVGNKVSRYRSALRANSNIKFMCDVNVKHGSHFIISDRSIAEQAHDAEEEGADILVVTGFETGKAPSPKNVEEFVSAVHIPVILGSGTTPENVAALLEHADGAIVGSFFKEDGDWKNPVSFDRTKLFMDAVLKTR